MTELKPCPFCGGKPFISYTHGETKPFPWAIVTCHDCDITTGLCWNEDVALNTWNTRQPQGINWQPMDTIPKDRAVLLLSEDGEIVKGKFGYIDPHTKIIFINYRILHGHKSGAFCSIRFFTYWAELTLPEVK